MDKSVLARKVQTLDVLSNEEKTALLELIRGHKKYGLVWEDKPEGIEERMRDELPVPVERNDDKVSPVISDNPEAPDHIIIEGDNLAALTELSYTHAGGIDVIYIDPPYNTGKEFIYNDNIIDGEDGFRHSKWLSFMKRRLTIAHKLLKPGGMMFISIDFHEQPALQLLCNEIFKEQNFVANTTVKGNPRGRQSSSYFAQVDDSLLVYRKSAEASLQGLTISDVTSKKRFNKTDSNGRHYEEWELRKRGADARRVDSPNLWYPIFHDRNTGTLSLERTSPDALEITPKLSTGEDGRWRWSKEKFLRHKDSLYARATRSGFNVFERKYAETKSRQLPPTIWDYPEVNTELGTKLLKEVMGNDVPFDYPKPVGLIKIILSLIPDPRAVVLDFFAGSGTTLHAVMQLNAEDGGKRQCILCTNNDNYICENVTYERNKRVINGYTRPDGETVEGLHDNNLRYYRTEFLPRERSVRNMRELVQAATGMLCIKNGIYTEAPFGGRTMNPKYARYFAKEKERMLVIYDERAIPFIADIIRTMPEDYRIKVYVFSHSSYAYDDEFADVADRVTLCALPQAIYEAYTKVMPERKPEFLVDDHVADIEKSGKGVER